MISTLARIDPVAPIAVFLIPVMALGFGVGAYTAEYGVSEDAVEESDVIVGVSPEEYAAAPHRNSSDLNDDEYAEENLSQSEQREILHYNIEKHNAVFTMPLEKKMRNNPFTASAMSMVKRIMKFPLAMGHSYPNAENAVQKVGLLLSPLLYIVCKSWIVLRSRTNHRV